MNPLVRFAVRTSLDIVERALRVAWEGANLVSGLLNDDSRAAVPAAAPRAAPDATVTRDPMGDRPRTAVTGEPLRGAGWRPPELGDLDQTADVLRQRRAMASP
ncbi:hypothetical protein, partial [Nostocoides sp.]|uniref:hypothetical protein n=1 Tax=Nostocoides sp. TaxID=1917966 RepID=UPI003C77AB69